MHIKIVDFLKNRGMFVIVVFVLIISLFSISKNNTETQQSYSKDQMQKCPLLRYSSYNDSIILSSELASFNLIEMPQISLINEKIVSEDSIPVSSNNEIERNGAGLLTTIAFAIIKPFIEKRIDQYLLQMGFSRQIQESRAKESLLSKKEIKLGHGQSIMCGQSVQVELVGRNADNNMLFDTQHQKEPLNMTIGRNEFFRGLELGIIGMKEGGERIIQIPKVLAYCINKDCGANTGANLEYLVKVKKIIHSPNPDVLKIKTIDAISSLDAIASCGDEVLIKIKTYDSNGAIIEDLSDKPMKFILSSQAMPEAIELGVIGMRKNGTRLIISPDSTINIKENMLNPIKTLRDKENIRMIEVQLIDLVQK